MEILRDVPLAQRTSLRIGGSARFFVEAANEAEVAEACEWARERGARFWVLGGGSNVVVPDTGLDGVVLALGLRGVTLEDAGSGVRLRAGAGESWDTVVARSVEAGLWGIECLSGIPGQVGATPIQNVGAYGQEVAETLELVRAFDRERRSFVEIAARECAFSYRDSVFKSR
ncbi:MAG TPA: FAD-binding protein, partial [Polyangiaceae bacterium]|nr:FAD-binding protein [Polyangiaceae bacterium]